MTKIITSKSSTTTSKKIQTQPSKAESVSIGISATKMKNVASLLNTYLADLHVLYIKTRNFHWNVEGPFFGPLHELFENLYKQLEATIDEVAERIRYLGLFTPGSLSAFLEVANLQDHPSAGTPHTDMLRILAEDHETIIRFLRDAIEKADKEYEDIGSADFLTGCIQHHEKTAWMLRVHLK